MSENLKKFLELISGDEELKQKVLACNEMEPADALCASIALAKEVGIELTEADFAQKEADGELNDDELGAVTGGVDEANGLCSCAFAGGGGGVDAKDHNVYGCACVMYGQGGDGRPEDKNCQCIATGWGDGEGFYFF